MFKSANEFSLHIEGLAIKKQTSYIEAILEYCEGNEIEPEELSEMISQILRDKLAVEFEEKNFLPRRARLL